MLEPKTPFQGFMLYSAIGAGALSSILVGVGLIGVAVDQVRRGLNRTAGESKDIEQRKEDRRIRRTVERVKEAGERGL